MIYVMIYEDCNEMLPSLVYARLDARFVTKSTLLPQMCDTIQQYCVGEYQVYDSKNKCRDFMDSIPPTSKAPGCQLNMGNSSYCRFAHTLLTKYRPELHCKHVSPDSDGKCSDDLCTGDSPPEWFKTVAGDRFDQDEFDAIFHELSL